MKNASIKLSRFNQFLSLPQKGRRLRCAAIGFLTVWYLVASLGLVIPACESSTVKNSIDETNSPASQPTIQLTAETSLPVKPNCCGKGAKCCCHSKTANGGTCCKLSSINIPAATIERHSNQDDLLAWTSCTCGSSSAAVVIVLAEDRLTSQPVMLLDCASAVEVFSTDTLPGSQFGDRPETPPPQTTA